VNETELARKVIQWLEAQYWDVYQEVEFPKQCSGRADIAALRDGKLWIIECKTSLTFTVLEQAQQWPAHFRSVAIPRSKDRRGRGVAYQIARNYLRIGVIEVGPFGADQVYPPPIMREHHKLAKRMIGCLRDEHKHYADAGSKSGGYFTPYRQTIETVKKFVRAMPGCTLKEIMAHLDGHHHYANDTTARSSLRAALSNWESTWCETRPDKQGRFHYYHK
jgi:hypothetical protein